jgi:hypothetical protein
MFLMSFIDLQYESVFPINIDREEEIEDYTRFSSRFFLLCNSCFWCASFLRHPSIFSKCPQCSKGEIDCMPTGQDESYNLITVLRKELSSISGLKTAQFSKNEILLIVKKLNCF